MIYSVDADSPERPWSVPPPVPPRLDPEVRRRVLKVFWRQSLGDIREDHPEIEVEQVSIQADHVHLVAVIPPKYAVSAVVGKIKANASREIRQRFPAVTKVYWRNEFWSIGFFASTVAIDEAVIQRYVEFQEKVDTGQLKLQLNFGFGSPVPRA